MQQLYYDNSSSLYLTKEDGVKVVWDVPVSNLITSASLNQIIAYSGSTPIAYFPLVNTDVFYPPFPNIPSVIQNLSAVSAATVNTSSLVVPATYTLVGSFSDTDVSGSVFSIYDNTSSSYKTLVSGSNVIQNTILSSGNSYTVKADKVLGSAPYTASLAIQELVSNSITASYYIFSGSTSNIAISASFTPQYGHKYKIDSSTTNNLISTGYYLNFSSSYDSYTASGSIFNISLANPPYTDLVAVSQSNQTGSTNLQAGTPYTVRMINVLANNITGSFSVYSNPLQYYIVSQSNVSDSYVYYTTIIPQVGDSYIVSASFIATGSV